MHLGVPDAFVDGPGWVRSEGRPHEHAALAEPIFARQAVAELHRADVPSQPGDWGPWLTALRNALPRDAVWTLHTVVADTNDGRAELLAAEAVAHELATRWQAAGGSAPSEAGHHATHLVQIGWLPAGRMALGANFVGESLSYYPGGVFRIRSGKDAPSRASSKLEEALSWSGARIGSEELVVDFGAAPGGWTWVAAKAGARVLAVDPGKLRPDLMKHRRVRYLCGSAFDFQMPAGETADWLLCDMAWRPMEVASLLAKWGRNRSARMLVANFKLPMKRKVPYAYQIIATLKKAGWKGLKARQLYHDRDEMTVFARLR